MVLLSNLNFLSLKSGLLSRIYLNSVNSVGQQKILSLLNMCSSFNNNFTILGNENLAIMEELNEEELKIFSAMPEASVLNLQNIIERINNMSETELIEKLKRFHLDTQGTDGTLRKRLKNSYKKVIAASKDLCVSSELLPYYVIIDFEATCEEVNPPIYRHEIIEFPAVIVNSKKQEIVDCFQMYCKPQINPTISKFCTELTGITQEQVDSAETFDKVLENFQKWLEKHNLGKKQKYAVVTDGPWDMSRFLYSQCHYSNVKFPKWGTKWVNLKKSFSRFYQCERVCLKNMIEYLGMEFIGRPHCGLDDAKNIARVLLRMIYDGANIQINERITVSKKHKERVRGKESSKIIDENGENQNVNKQEKLRIEAHYAAVYYMDKIPLYKNTERERLIGEIQLARKISNNSVSSEKTNSDRKLKLNKKKTQYC